MAEVTSIIRTVTWRDVRSVVGSVLAVSVISGKLGEWNEDVDGRSEYDVPETSAW